ncbi:MAG: adenosine kinase [Alphaproteobacteria bacterium]|nr:adenosine kinase [Alphaproteobacteria bacterium]
MSEHEYDVVALGNAIVDILSYADDAFLERFNLPKGGMTLITDKQAELIYAAMGTATECSGGSAANTAAGVAGLGARVLFIGKVKDDQFGDIFTHDITHVGVEYHTPKAKKGKPTAQCLVIVTHEGDSRIKAKNAERTMATYLGASTDITAADVDEASIRVAKVTYIEGYLWDQPAAKEACMKAIHAAHDAGNKVAFTLSDPFCVDRHRKDFLNLVEKHVDILFANEHEIRSLFEEEDLRKIIIRLQGVCEVAAVTRSAKGSYIITSDGSVHDIPAHPVEEVYDVTGAGDLYASGFLYGYVNGWAHEKSGALAARCAAEVIKYLGGRPLTDLSVIAQEI